MSLQSHRRFFLIFLLSTSVVLLLLLTTTVARPIIAQEGGQAPKLVPGPFGPAGVLVIGDYVWLDADMDGEQDADETGIDDVKVNRWLDANGNGVLDANDILVDWVFTGDDPDTPGTQHGFYLFNNVAGNETYFIEIDATNFDPGNPLNNYVLTSDGTYGPNPMTVVLGSSSFRDADFGYAPQSGAIRVTKTANPSSVSEPGGNVTFTIVVENPNAGGALILTDLTDSIYGSLHGKGNCALPQSIPPAGSYTCQFTEHIAGNAGDTVTNVVTATGTDPNNNQVSDTDEATVTITDVPSSMQVLKNASPSSLPEPGGNVTFSVEVQNTSSADPITITGMSDSVYGDLSQRGTCVNAIGQVIQPGDSYTCQFTAQVTGSAGDTETDVVNVTATDDDNHTLQDNDDATVTITNAASSIQVHKSANPTIIDAPGGDVTFTVEIQNTSTVDTVTITSLVDSVFGNLNGQGNCHVNVVLQPAETYTCQFIGHVSGQSGDTHTDIVTASGHDDDGDPVSDNDSATVQITGGTVSPFGTIRVTKVADPKSVREPGGVVTYRVSVSNPLDTTITLTSLIDSLYGDVSNQGTCQMPQTLPPNGTYQCEFQEYVSGNANESKLDIITVNGVDPGGNPVRSSDSAVVDIVGDTASIILTKKASPTTLVEPGGLVFFTISITNTSPSQLPVTITTLNDSIYGDLNNQGTCSLPQTIQYGNKYECVFVANITGPPGHHEMNVATAEGQDPANRPVRSQDSADVFVVDAPSRLVLTKTANPSSVDEPGGSVVFQITLRNEGTVDTITVDTMLDSIYGNLNGKGSCVLPQTLGPGAEYTCQFNAMVTGNGGDHETDVVIASGQDDDGNDLTASDDATVDINDLPSRILLSKTADPTSLPEPGGPVTFTVVVANISQVDQVTVQSLVDNVYGDLNGKGDCQTPQVLNAGESYTCQFTAVITGDVGDKKKDTVTVSAVDDDGHQLSATDEAEVTIVNVPPTIEVNKSAIPNSVPEPGGSVTFRVEVHNTSASDVVQLVSLLDSVYGDLNGRGTCSLPQSLDPGEVYVCTFDEIVHGQEGDSHTDVVIASGVDEEGSPATDSDDATVDVGPPSSLPGCISGYKVDEQHVGLPYWRIHAKPLNNPNLEYIVQTDGSGYFELPNLAPGTWEVWEEVQSGWEPVTADRFQVMVYSGSNCVRVRFKNRQTLTTPTSTPTPTTTPGCPCPTQTPTPTRTPTPRPTATVPSECEAGRLEFNIWGTDYSIPLWDDAHVWSVWGLPWQRPTVFVIRNYTGRVTWIQYQPYYHKQEGGYTFIYPGGRAGKDFTLYVETRCGKLQLQGAIDDPTVTPDPNLRHRVWVPVIVNSGYWGAQR